MEEKAFWTALLAFLAVRGEVLSSDPCADIVIPLQGDKELRLPALFAPVQSGVVAVNQTGPTPVGTPANPAPVA